MLKPFGSFLGKVKKINIFTSPSQSLSNNEKECTYIGTLREDLEQFRGKNNGKKFNYIVSRKGDTYIYI